MDKQLSFDEIIDLIANLDDESEFLEALGVDQLPEGDIRIAMLSRVAHAAYAAGMSDPGVAGADGNIIHVGDVFEDTTSKTWRVAEGVNQDGFIITEWLTAANPKNCCKVDIKDKQELISKTSSQIISALKKHGNHIELNSYCSIDDILRIFAYQVEGNWENTRKFYIDEEFE